MTDPDDDYLWDRSGAPDPEIRRLEDLLSSHAYTGSAPPLPVRRHRPWMLAVATILVAASALFAILQIADQGQDVGRAGPHPKGIASSDDRPGWSYRLTTDQRGGASHSSGTLRVGDWLETAPRTVAEVDVADIGRVTLDPGTRLQLLATGKDQHRVHLARGRMSAVVDAPPELFIAETPAATAVDMGCAYELVVDEAENGYLRVTLGLVELRRDGRRSVVPAGAICEARAQRGLGTPRFETAGGPLKVGLRRIDFDAGGLDALDEVISSAGIRDSLTLWHLLQHPRFAGEGRERVLDALETLTDMPISATREGTLALDPQMLDAWYWRLERFW